MASSVLILYPKNHSLYVLHDFKHPLSHFNGRKDIYYILKFTNIYGKK